MSLLEQRIFEVEFHSRKVQKFECTCQCFLKKTPTLNEHYIGVKLFLPGQSHPSWGGRISVPLQ